MRRGVVAVLCALLLVAPVPARAAEQVELVADAAAQSFAVRPSYDSGGANPLNLYIGYSDATLTTPEPAQGQASWYNFNIAETAAFADPRKCVPFRDPNSDGTTTPDALNDVQGYLEDYIAALMTYDPARDREDLEAQRPPDGPPKPLVPSIRGLCSERLAGFAQSLYPPTATIPQRSSDTYFDKPSAASACRDHHANETPDSTQCRMYKEHWPMFSSAARGFVRDGAYAAESTSKGQSSIAVTFGAGDGSTVSVGLSVMRSDITMDGDTLTARATTLLHDVCILVTASGCTLEIETVRQVASVTREAGKTPVREQRTVMLGVHGSGVADEITAEDLFLEQGQFKLGDAPGGYLGIAGVSRTRGCDASVDDPAVTVADAGGIVVFGSGGAGAQGGSIMIGGACVSTRLAVETLDVPEFLGDPGFLGTPDQTITIPGVPGGLPGGARTLFGPPRVVTKTVTRYALVDPIAWRTAPYWGSVLGAMALLFAFAYAFRRSPYVQPAARAADRFARQFLRG